MISSSSGSGSASVSGSGNGIISWGATLPLNSDVSIRKIKKQKKQNKKKTRNRLDIQPNAGNWKTQDENK